MLTVEGFYELEMHILRNKNASPKISNIEHIHDEESAVFLNLYFQNNRPKFIGLNANII